MNRIIRLVEVIREVKQWRSCSKVLFSFWQGEGLNSLEVTYRGLKSFIDESGFNSCDALCKISGYIETHIIELLNGERIEYIFSWNENPSFNKEELLLLKGMLHLVASRCSTTERVTRISHSAWEKLKKTKSVPGLIAESIAMKECLHMAGLVAPYDTAVLIQGESGTGKELLANYIHEHSPRRKNTFIKVNCAAIPESLIESTLFGHEQGAFTGAVNIHKGYFERAKGGTIFLDEIAELSPQVQSKLLRVLETGDFERVGSIKSLQADVRVISASHRDYDKCLATNSFREDLFYRINTFSLQVPPLRERKEEIQVLCDYLITKLCEKLKIAFHSYHNSFQQVLLQHDWPGNVRELRNELERSLIIAAGKSPLKLHLRSKRHESYHGGLDEQTKQIIITALRQCGGKVHGVGGAAELLKLNPQTLYSKIRKMDISI